MHCRECGGKIEIRFVTTCCDNHHLEEWDVDMAGFPLGVLLLDLIEKLKERGKENDRKKLYKGAIDKRPGKRQ